MQEDAAGAQEPRGPDSIHVLLAGILLADSRIGALLAPRGPITRAATLVGLVALAMVMAFGGVASLWMAVVADMGASLVVIGNALRLLRE